MPVPKVRINGQWIAIGGQTIDTTEIINTAVSKSNDYTQQMIQEVNESVSEINESLGDTREYIDGAFRDGILTSIEISRIKSYLNELAVDKSGYDKDYQTIHDNPDLSQADRDSMEYAFNLYDTDYNNLVNYINEIMENETVTQEQSNHVDDLFHELQNSINLLASSIQTGLNDIAQKKANDAEIGANGYTDNQMAPVTQRLSTVETNVVQINGELSSKISQDDYEIDMSALNNNLMQTQQSLQETDQYIDGAFRDGIITEAEAKKIQSYIKTLDSDQATIEQRYTQTHNDSVISDTDRTNMETAKNGYDEAYQKLITDINNVIVDSSVIDDENDLVDNDFESYHDALSLVTQMIEVAAKNNALIKAKNAGDEARQYASELKSQTDDNFSDVSESISNTQNYIDGAFRDGLISSTESNRIGTYLNTLGTEKAGFDKEYNTVYNDPQLVNGSKDNLYTAYTNFISAYNTLVQAINSIVSTGAASPDDTNIVNTYFGTYYDASSDLSDALMNSINFIAQMKANKALQDAKNYVDAQLGDYVQATLYQQDMDDIRNQIDGQINSWYYNYDPTLDNAPANGWTTDADREAHVGDYFLNQTSGQAFRFTRDGSTYKWNIVTDNAIAEALQTSQLAKDTADSKRRTFTEIPVPPYDPGDLWVNDSNDPNNPVIYQCQVQKYQEQSFDMTDWRPVGDMTALNTAYDTMRLNGQDAGLIVDRLSTAESNVVQLSDEISNMVTITEYNDYTHTVDEAFGAVDQQFQDMADDSKITPVEKKSLLNRWKSIQAEKDTLDAQADSYDVNHTDYDNKYDSLSSYITPIFSDMSSVSTVDGPTYRSQFSDYNQAKTSLQKDVTDASMIYSDQVSQAKANLAETQAKAYADGKVSDEEQARINDAQQKYDDAVSHADSVAQAKANLAETQAKAYADGKVSDEEQRAIQDAQQKYDDAVSHTNQVADDIDTHITEVSGDIDQRTGSGKWLFEKYDRGSVSQSKSPTYATIQGKTPVGKYLAADGDDLVHNIGDNYIGYLATALYVQEGKNISFTYHGDDASRLYVNGESKYAMSTGTSTQITVYLNQGWNTVEIIFVEGTGDDGVWSITPTLSSQVDQMSCYFASENTGKPVTSASGIMDDEGNVYGFTTTTGLIKNIGTKIILKVDEMKSNGENLISMINLDSSSATISARHVNIDGAVTFSSFDSDTWSNINNQNAISESNQYADSASSIAENNAKGYADQVSQAKADLAETRAKAYADGKVSDEEQRAIQDAQNRYNDAVSHANSVSSTAEQNAKDYSYGRYEWTKNKVGDRWDIWDDANSKINWQTINSPTDLNNMRTTGKFLITGTLTNSPVLAWVYLVVEARGTDRIYQQVRKDNADQVYERRYNGSWSTWIKVANKNDVDTAQNNAQNYADSVAQAKANLAKTEAQSYADGKVSTEEQRAIQDAQNRYNDAVEHANSVAGTAQANAQNYAYGRYEGTKSLVNGWKATGTTEINGGVIKTDSLSSISANLGEVNVTDNINFTTPNKGINASYNITENPGAVNPRQYIGTMTMDHFLTSYLATIGYVNTTTNPGAIEGKYFNETYFGPDILKMRHYDVNDHNKLWMRTDIYGGSIQVSDNWGNETGSRILVDSIGVYADDASGFCEMQADGSFFARNILINGYHSIQTTDGGDLWFQDQLSQNNVNINCKGVRNSQGTLRVEGAYGSSMYFGNDGKNRVWSTDIYNRTYSGSANVEITAYGTIGRTTSATKYKENIQYDLDKDADKILNLKPATWHDKSADEDLARSTETGDREADVPYPERYAGLIAEDLENNGLKQFVSYGKQDSTGHREPEGIQYDRLWVLLIPVINKMKNEYENRLSILEKRTDNLMMKLAKYETN